MAHARVRLMILVVATLELAPVAWLLVRTWQETPDWSRPYALEVLWIPGLLGAPALLALILAAAGRALGAAVILCVAYALVVIFFLGLAQTATVAG